MTLDKGQFIKVYLNRLVHSLVPPEFGAEFTQSLVNEIVTYLLSQNAETRLSLGIVLDQCKSRFLSSHKVQDWIRFQALVDNLSKEKLLDQIAAYLVFLTEMLNNAQDHSGLNTLPHPDLLSSPVGANNLGESYPQSQLTQFSTPQNGLAHADILSSLQYTLLGQDTNFLRFEKGDDSVTLPAEIDSDDAQLLGDIVEPGLLFRYLQTSLEGIKGKESSPIKNSLFRCTEVLLTNYVSFVNQIFESNQTSLLGVYEILQEQIKILRILNFIYRQSSKLDGYNFLIEIYKLSKFGDTSIRQLSLDIFHQIVVPYYEYLEQWIIQGELIDENGEFFVSFNVEHSHIQDIVEYNPQKLPSFFGFEPSTYQKIFQIGKMLIFLDKYCKEIDWLNDYASRYSKFIFGTHKGLKFMDSNLLRSLIEHQYNEIISYFTILLESKFELFLHLSSLKTIMFMSSSDFIDTVFQRGFDTLSEPAMNLTSAKLSELLTRSISSSSVQNMPSRYRDNIDARILDLSHGTVGWDVFTLEYKLPSLPAELLLNHRDERTQYLRLFNFLWGVRHFQYYLNHNFLEFQSLYKNNLRKLKSKRLVREGQRVKVEWFFKAIRTINLIRYKLLMLVNTIVGYFSFDLIEKSFDEEVVTNLFRLSSILDTKSLGNQSRKDRKLPIIKADFADKCSDKGVLIGLERDTAWKHNGAENTIDEIINIHKRYLGRISDCKLLDENIKGKFSNESYVNQIYQLLNYTFTFMKSSEEFGASVINFVNVLDLTESSDSVDYDEDLNDLHKNLSGLMKMIHGELYMRRIRPLREILIKDLRADVDFKDLSKLL